MGNPFLRTRLSRVSVLDAGIALGLFGLGLLSIATTYGGSPPAQDRDAFGILLMAAETLPLAWRQRNPRLVLCLTLGAWMVDRAQDYQDTLTVLGIVVAVHAVAAYLPARSAYVWGGVSLFFSLGWTAIGAFMYDQAGWAELAGVVLSTLVPFGIGRSDALSRERLTKLEMEHQGLERAQREATVTAVRTERTRIARELHDVVAHEITVMTLQAEGARRALGDAKPAVTEALQTISDSGRKGLAEMNRMIGVLRDSSETDMDEARIGTSHAPASVSHLDPMPALASLPALARQVEDAGLPVDLKIQGNAHVPAGVELSAYRIVQESLTNALKHAGPGAQASVVVLREPSAVTVTVEDDGRGIIADTVSNSGGHGQAGMRERVLALGGSIEYGPRPGGGFRVLAVLPSHDDTVVPAPRKGTRP